MMNDLKTVEHYMHNDYEIKINTIHDEAGKYYSASIPDLPGLEVFEDSKAAALKSLEDAKKEWITTALKRGFKIPEPHIVNGKVY